MKLVEKNPFSRFLSFEERRVIVYLISNQKFGKVGKIYRQSANRYEALLSLVDSGVIKIFNKIGEGKLTEIHFKFTDKYKNSFKNKKMSVKVTGIFI